jgi:hypothetical protein
VSVSWRPKDDNSEADWRLAFSCVGEIDLGRIPGYVGREHRRAQPSCVSSQRWGRPTRAGDISLAASDDVTEERNNRI